MSRAYYNEFDKHAAAWLRELIKAGLIADGDVDERSIEDVLPSDLRSYTQCHFFAGVGVWSHAFRQAGWRDDRPVWSGSCPCQPFSAAGKGAAFADERHLWPAFFHLIEECRPAVIFGEQVASKDADPWIDLVQDDLEAVDYAFGAIPFPSAGVGAPHLRDRMYWVADLHGAGREPWGEGRKAVGYRAAAQPDCGAGRVADADGLRGGRNGGGVYRPEGSLQSAGRVDGRDADGFGHGRESVGLADAYGRHTGAERQQCGGQQRQQPADGRCGGVASGGMDNAERIGWGTRGNDDAQHDGQQFDAARNLDRPGPLNGYWRDADWLFCRDVKWRPVEPGTFPLVARTPSGMVPSGSAGLPIDANQTAEGRVMRLRGYGNAINAVAAQTWIEIYMNGKS